MTAALGAIAGLFVIAACSDTSSKSITAPTSIRKASIGSGGFNQAKKLTLCLDAGAPTGVYTFVNTAYNRSLVAPTGPDGFPFALLGNGNNPSGSPTYDSGDGGDGSTTSNTTSAGTHYTLTITQPTAPTVGNGGCVVVLNRTSGDADFMAALPNTQGGSCVPGVPSSYPPGAVGCGGVNDQFAAADIQYLSSTAAVVYDHTDCLLDNGVTNPERVSPPAGFTPSGASGLSFQDGTQPDGLGGFIPASPPNYPCGPGFNPVRAFANYEHGSTVTFAFSAPTGNNCSFTQGYYKNHESYTASVLSSNVGTTYVDGAGKLLIGSYVLSAAQIDAILGTAAGKGYNAGGVVFTKDQLGMIHQLITAELNVTGGEDASAITATITAANNYTSATKTQLSTWTNTLDDFNSGKTGPGHCSS